MLYREIIAVCSQIHTKHITWIIYKDAVRTAQLSFVILFNCFKSLNQPESYLNTQSVPRSKHTPSRLYKPVS